MRISALSTEYLRYKVTATTNGQAINPTTDAVAFAFAPEGSNPGSFTAGTWETDAGGTYVARCLVGPANNGLTPGTGTYVLWIKITDSPEVPVRRIDTVTFT